jgi:hypothetical protein
MSGSARAHVRPRGAAVLLAALAVALGGCASTTGGTASPAGGTAPAPPSSAAAPTPAAPSSTPAANGGGQATAGDAFDDAQGRFDLLPPKGWKVDTSGAQGTAAVFLDPDPVSTPKGAFQPNVNVIVAPSPGGQLADLLDGTRTELASLNKYKSTTDQDVTLDDGTQAHLFGGTFTDQASGLDLRNLQLFTVDDKSVYVVTGTAPVSAWDQYESELDASLRSMTLKA